MSATNTKEPALAGWDLIGEDCEAMVHDGHLPLDWRTKAKALQAHDDKACALDCFPLSGIEVVHGALVKAPPGEWFESGRGEYYTWNDTPPDETPDGWFWTDVEHTDCAWREFPYSAADIPEVVCLGLDSWPAGDTIAVAARNAGPEVSCVTPGEGWPWLCRVVRPVTVVVLR
jgi:hypothetical protein